MKGRLICGFFVGRERIDDSTVAGECKKKGQGNAVFISPPIHTKPGNCEPSRGYGGDAVTVTSCLEERVYNT